MDSAENGWWITETTTYKIHAESEEEARAIWQKYWADGTDPYALPMKIKDSGVEADWNWEV